MNKYESVIIIKKDITEEERKDIISKIEQKINANGKVTKTENLGLKRLAYEIRNHNQAYYYVIEFDAEGQAICEIKRFYRITDEILKFIVIRKED